MELQTLKDLYIHELKDLYDAEQQQIVEALPKMAKAATEAALVAEFKQHLEETKEQITRLEKILFNQGQSTRGPRSKSMVGLVDEVTNIIEEEEDVEVSDAKLLAAAQRIEHYEMAGYGTARAFAELLGDKEGAKLLQTTFEEEAAIDRRVSALLEQILIGGTRAEKSDLRFHAIVDPGSATSAEIAEVFEAISQLNRAFGGEGIFVESSQQREVTTELTR